jgi:hypothetical protein
VRRKRKKRKSWGTRRGRYEMVVENTESTSIHNSSLISDAASTRWRITAHSFPMY